MRIRRLILGILAGNAFGGILCWLGFRIIATWPSTVLGVSAPSLFLVPLSIGLVSALFWRPLELGLGQTVLHATLCSLVALASAALVFREGLICLIILSPILYGSVLTGALIGRILFRNNNGRVNLWVTPALALFILAEPGVRRPFRSVVADEIRIAAPPAAVWPHVLAFERIPAPADYWLFRLGLPYPTETTNGGDYVGADRACRFSGDAVFKERIIEFEPQRRLTFDIVEAPPDPELIGHLDASRGQFELRDNGDGTTTLIGRTWYTLHLHPAAYFRWWTHHVFGAVHQRVMENVKRLAEAHP